MHLTALPSHLRRGVAGESAHDAIRIVFPNLGDQQGSHSSSSSATHRMHHLEALQAVTSLALPMHNLHDAFNHLGTLCVVPFCPVVTCARISKGEVIRSEEASVGPRTHRVQSARFKISQYCPWYHSTTSRLHEVDVDALDLEVRVAPVETVGTDAMLVCDHLPKLDVVRS